MTVIYVTAIYAKECEPGWRYFQSYCYYLSNDTSNAFDAQDTCQYMGASLASLTTTDEDVIQSIPIYSIFSIANPCHSEPFPILSQWFLKKCPKQGNIF